MLVSPNPAAEAAPEPQAVVTPLSGAAAFLVVEIKPGEAAEDTVRDLIADLPALVRAVGFRDLDGFLSCVTGLSDSAWSRLAAGWPGRRGCIRSGRSAPARGTPSQRRVTCCSTSGLCARTCASSWPRRSWGGSGTR